MRGSSIFTWLCKSLHSFSSFFVFFSSFFLSLMSGILLFFFYPFILFGLLSFMKQKIKKRTKWEANFYYSLFPYNFLSRLSCPNISTKGRYPMQYSLRGARTHGHYSRRTTSTQSGRSIIFLRLFPNRTQRILERKPHLACRSVPSYNPFFGLFWHWNACG